MDSSRQYSEVLAFDMTADTQAVLSSPTVSQDTELITLSSVDVGQPLLEVEAWDDFWGNRSRSLRSSSRITQLLRADWPIRFVSPPGRPGRPNLYSATSLVRLRQTTASCGQVWAEVRLRPRRNGRRLRSSRSARSSSCKNQVFNPATGDFEDIPGEGVYYICTSAGQTNSTYTEFSYTPPVVSNVEVTPAVKFINYIKPPAYVTSVGAQVATVAAW